MPDGSHRAARLRLLAFTYGLPVLVALTLGSSGLFTERWFSDAGYYTAISLKASREGCWWTLMQGGVPYFNKPPLAFWIHAAFAKVLGEIVWALKLPELLAHAATAGLLASLALRLHGPRIALFAGLFMAASNEALERIANFRLDQTHALFITLAARLAAEGIVRSGRARDTAGARGGWWIVSSGAAIGLALMVKPIFALLMFPVLAAWMRLSRPSGRRSRVPWLLGAFVVSMAVAAPWHISMAVLHPPASGEGGGGGFVNQYFFEESLKRATGESFQPEPWWWYFHYLVASDDNPFRVYAYWPILAMASGAAVCWLTGVRLHRRARGALLAQCWLLGFAAALTIFPDKRSYYLFIVLPPLAWIAALWAYAALRPRRWRRARVAIAAAAIALAAYGVVGAVRAAGSPDPRPEWLKLSAFLSAPRPDGSPRPRLHNGNLMYYYTSALYITAGVWPEPGGKGRASLARDVPAGDWIVFALGDVAPAPPLDADVREIYRGRAYRVVEKTSTPP